MENASFLVVLRNRHFLFLWLAQAISQTAQNMINFALLVEVETLTQSTTAVSLVILAFAVPAVIFSAIAGVFVDRADKKSVLVITNAVRGVVVLGYLFANPHWTVTQTILFFGLITFAFSSISQFFSPAEGTMIPLLVHREDLITANSLFNLTFIGSQLVGLALLGPALILIIGTSQLFFLVFLLYMICVGLVMLLPKTEVKVNGSEQGLSWRQRLARVWGDLRAGWNFIVGDRAIVTAIIHLSLATSLFLMLATIGPGFMTRVIGIGASNFGFVLIPGGFGMIAGVFFVNRLATRINREVMINGGVGIFGLVLLILGFLKPAADFIAGLTGQPAPVTPIIIALMILGFVFGATVALISIPAQTVLQERSPEEVRGRVIATFFMVSNAFSIIPILFAGTLGDIIGIARVMMFIGLAALLASGLGLYFYYRAGLRSAA